MIRKIASRFVFDRKPDQQVPYGRSENANDSGDPSARGFVSFIAVISIIGLSLGVTALLVVTSVMNGFDVELKKALTAFHGHIMLFSRADPVSDPNKIISEILKNKEVVAVTPYIFSEVMLSSKSAVTGSVVEGIDLDTVDKVSEVRKKVIEGQLPKSTQATISLGFELARKLRVRIGDSVLLTVPFAKGGESSLVQKLEVVGILKFGMFDYDSKYALVELGELQKILEVPGQVNAFRVLTKDASKSLNVAAELNDRFAYPLRARDWSSLNRNLFYAIRLQKAVISILLLSIVLVASFNIISTLMMMVHDKKKQISILKAMGWGPKKTFAVFLLIGSSMSVVGTILGVLTGWLLCSVIQWKSIIDLPGDIYLLTRLPAQIHVYEWLGISILSIFLAIVSTLWPSFKISRESPVEGLRYE